jgi:helicase MOV-10
MMLRSKPRVLVCAPNNSAVDVLCQRFIDAAGSNIPHLSSLIFRAFAPSRFRENISSGCKDVLKYTSIDERNDTFQFPEEGLQSFRMVFCTLSYSFTVLRDGHFSEPDLILVDEAGQALESETLIPMAFSETIASLVLAGDPYQLGPTCKSFELEHRGLNMSLLERLMQTRPYRPQADSETEFDARYVVKLVKNFRSHDSLLEVPRRLFYNNRLEAHGDRGMTHTMVGWSRLPEPNTPLVVHDVHGRHRREGTSMSLLNLEELVVVKEWVSALLTRGVSSKDIGVISPYQQQCKYLEQELRSMSDVTIGTVEKFQGDERRVIIVSTVRCLSKAPRKSHASVGTVVTKELGFLADPKRFNVSITRAQSLLIVIGDIRLLSKDAQWRSLIQHAKELGCMYKKEE